VLLLLVLLVAPELPLPVLLDPLLPPLLVLPLPGEAPLLVPLPEVLPPPLLPDVLPLDDPLLDPLDEPLVAPLSDPLDEPLVAPLSDPPLSDPLDDALPEPLPPLAIARRAPLGLPQPVGPSQPVPAVQSADGEQLPLLPLVTSKKSIVFCHTKEGSVLTCITVNAAATSGAAALVPPTSAQPADPDVSEQYTATPVRGSASDDTSASARIEQAVSVCQLGLATVRLQPLPAPLHAASAHPRDDDDCVSDVPPTATTPEYVAGEEGPAAYPLSPEDAVMRTPLCLYEGSSCESFPP